jgi:hypothetical protein
LLVPGAAGRADGFGAAVVELLVVPLVLGAAAGAAGMACQFRSECEAVGLGDASAAAGCRGQAVVVLMSRRSREAVTLARHLCIYWSLRPGAVEMRWSDGWYARGTYRQGWEVAWDDGPTVERMRQAAQVFAGPAIGEVVRADLVRYQRYLTLTAWAVSLVRHVRDGNQIPELADPRTEDAWRESLERTEYPERARTPEEQALAGVLLRRGLRDYHRARAAAERAWTSERRRLPAPPMPEVLMGRALATFGLDALVVLEQASNIVELPRHRLDRDGGLGLP